MATYSSGTITDVTADFTAGELITVEANALVSSNRVGATLHPQKGVLDLSGSGTYIVNIQGSVFGYGSSSSGIRIHDTGAGPHEITVGATGSISGHDGAILVSSASLNLKLVNRGSILSDVTGIGRATILVDSDGSIDVTNNGVISGKSSDAIRFGGNGTHVLTGSGTIGTYDASRYAYISMDANAVEQIDYDGSILGRVSLGGGADTLDIVEGRITGHVELGYGNDIYKGSNSLSTADSVEAGADNDQVWGNAGNDSINGDSGDDTIYGGAGNDTLLGATNTAAGDWVSYFFDSAGVRVSLAVTAAQNTIGAGVDTIAEFENLQGSNGFADVLSGSASVNRISGAGGNDLLFGGADVVADTLIGGLGNDIFKVNTSDLIVEAAGQGAADRVRALQTFALAADDHIEFMEAENAAGVAAINLTGNNLLGQTINGNAGNNILSGLGGADILNGLGGGDTLIGGLGNDRLNGGAWRDTLNGGAGRDILGGGADRDRFVFHAGDSGLSAATMDVITDYTKGAQGAAGAGEAIDYAAVLKIGGTAAAATSSAASIHATKGTASFAAGSGASLSDCLTDIAGRIHASGTQAGEFALFRVANAGPVHLFISDGVAGVSLGDVVVQFANVFSVNSIGLLNGDLTILT